VSALKLQHGAAPAELSAASQLVMLTQRIGKSANELLTVEGVSPEAVFLLGKDLNSFKEIARACWTATATCGWRRRATRRRATRSPAAQAVRGHPRPGGAILGNLQAW
jgi:twitching motility protein PilJ